ncbi:MAG TPA: hypothetical protein VER03_07395 [Bryobacteraceae bacterium]|nr:hypothetical protein [Bryobacteraceae bacterium]
MRRRALLLSFLSRAFAAESVYLGLRSAGEQVVYLSAAGQVLGTVRVGQVAHHMALSPDKRRLYMTADEATATIVDIASRRRIGDISLSDNRRPRGIGVNAATGEIAIVTEQPSGLLLIDPSRRIVRKRYDTKGSGPANVTFGPAGSSWAYVSNTASGTVAAIHTGSGETKIIRTGDRPGGSTLSSDGKELYVPNQASDNIAIVDTAKQQVSANIITGKGPVSAVVDPAGKTLLYALSKERRVAFADLQQRQQTDYVLVPADPVSCSLSTDHRSVLVATTGSVYIISIASRRITAEIKPSDGFPVGAVLECGSLA